MVFDRNAINTGRRIQDFGLCDLSGVYQNSAKMRAKGFLAVAFLLGSDQNSIAVAKQLQEWVGLSDKLSVAAIVMGERAEVEVLASDAGVSYTVLWDFEDYVTAMWAVTAAPAVFITDSQGVVLGRVIGADLSELNTAKAMLTDEIHRAAEAARAAAEAATAKAAAATPPAQGGAPGPVTPSPAGVKA